MDEVIGGDDGRFGEGFAGVVAEFAAGDVAEG